MTALKKLLPITIEDFIEKFEGSRCQFHEGEVWEAQATSPNHSFLQSTLSQGIGNFYNKSGGPRLPGGWWIFTEVAVRYGEQSLFSHDLAGWKRALYPERPKRFPITSRPDWVCEILSSNETNDLVKKKSVLHEHGVPYYWVVEPNDKVITVFEWHEKGYLSILDVTEGSIGKILPFDAINLKANVLFGEEDE
jgi:Uma2 family endonuclease